MLIVSFRPLHIRSVFKDPGVSKDTFFSFFFVYTVTSYEFEVSL